MTKHNSKYKAAMYLNKKHYKVKDYYGEAFVINGWIEEFSVKSSKHTDRKEIVVNAKRKRK